MSKYLKSTILVVAILILSACGGGGSIGESIDSANNLPSKPDSSKMANLNDTNSSKLAFLVFNTLTSSDNSDLLNPDIVSSSNIDNSKNIKRFNKLYKKECQTGSVDINVNQNEQSATFTFNNCINSGVTYNGKVKVYYYAEDTFDAIYQNLTIKNSLATIEIPKAKIYFMGQEPYEMENTYMFVKLKNGKEFNYFNFNATNYGNEHTFSGYIKTFCLNNYIYIKSKDKIYIENNNIKGEFTISSLDKKIKVNFDKDLAFVTLPNKKEEVYSSKNILKVANQSGCDISIKAEIPYRPKSSDFVSFGDDNKNSKIASASFNLTNNIASKFPALEDVYNYLDVGLNCISGSIKEVDSGNKIIVTYNNCQVDDNVTYSGKISYIIGDDSVSKIELNNLQIKYNNSSTFIKSAVVTKNIDNSTSITSFKIDNLYATINGNEYLNFNFEYSADFDKNIDFNGYIKPKCLDKFIYLDNSSYDYDYISNNLELINLYIFNEPYYKNSAIDMPEWISVNIGLTTNSIEIDFYGSLIELSLQDFINKCK